jgi:hypothetical protein
LHIDLKETYRIIPFRRAYRVEAIQPNGQKRVVRTWPTEEAAVSHLKALRELAERSGPAKRTGAAMLRPPALIRAEAPAAAQ